MSAFQELFGLSNLDVIVPDTSIEFPGEAVDVDEWLFHLRTPTVERKLAFFDETLDYYLTIQLGHLGSPQKPPPKLLAFLSFLQISFDASYISSVPLTPNHENPPHSGRPAYTPARSSLLLAGPPKPRNPPSIFPPATPHPIPSTAESDRRYIRSEGTPLSSGVWGENPSEEFQLLWSESNNSWVAVYKLSIGVAFVRMSFTDPLLCLTVSTTLRDKPAPPTAPRRRLAELIDAVGGIPSDLASPITTLKKKDYDASDDDEELTGLEEVNLLGGLSSAPTFSAEGISMPSTRLGPAARRETFSLRPITSGTPSSPDTPTPTLRTSASSTLRKSFRKTLKTVSGFRVRMRTVFVPYVLFSEYHLNAQESQCSSDLESEPGIEEGDEWDRERKEAGNDESTVVLCVEVENSGDSGMGFTVESVDVHISGEGAKTTLIRWGIQEDPTHEVFPLLIAPIEQYNLLYAVTFLESPEASDLGGRNWTQGDLQRAVTITIHGKPYDIQDADETAVIYPTHTFSSRWNCILDLSANINKALADAQTDSPMKGNKHPEALPTPASPFPGIGPSTPRQTKNPPQEASVVSGSKRHALRAITPFREASARAPVNYRSPISMLNPAIQKEKAPPQSSQITSQQSSPNRFTTYGSAPTSPPLPDEANPPLTPAYPAYPNSPALPQAAFSQVPVASTQSSVGPSVEIRRGGGDRVLGGSIGRMKDGMSSGGTILAGAGGEGEEQGGGEPIVVSVGLLPLRKPRRYKELGRAGAEMIYPNDRFTLDIFVFNQSSWMRRFEVSYPNGRSWRKQLGTSALSKGQVGILPLENRIRVGPLRPSTCQSVRMDFLALVPGVHPVDTLILTDIETGYTVNLRSVMDIVVHEPPTL